MLEWSHSEQKWEEEWVPESPELFWFMTKIESVCPAEENNDTVVVIFKCQHLLFVCLSLEIEV